MEYTNIGNIGVTFLGKCLSFHIEICGFWPGKPQKLLKPQISQFLQISCFIFNLWFFKICEILIFYQNPRILQSWGSDLSSRKIFHTKDQWRFHHVTLNHHQIHNDKTLKTTLTSVVKTLSDNSNWPWYTGNILTPENW